MVVNMVEDLSKLLYDYVKQNKNFDEEFINKVVEVFVNEKNIYYYLRKVILAPNRESLNSDRFTVSTYNPISKEITLYIEGIYKLLFQYKNIHYLFNKKQLLFFENALVMQSLLHELEHANQRKTARRKDDLEAKLLKVCLPDLILDQRHLLIDKGYSVDEASDYIFKQINKMCANYKKYYSISPDERLAEIKSLQNIRVVLKNIKKASKVSDFIGISLLETSLVGYSDIDCPAITYLINTDNENILKQFSWYDENTLLCLKKTRDNFSLQDRILYGLPIDIKEKREIEDNIMYSKKYMFK